MRHAQTGRDVMRDFKLERKFIHSFGSIAVLEVHHDVPLLADLILRLQVRGVEVPASKTAST